MAPTIDRKTYSYSDYKTLTEQLVVEGKTTGPNQSEAMAHYTKMNMVRMNRLDKTLKLDSALVDAVKGLGDSYDWTVITEAWCGDAAQNLPVISALAEHNSAIDLKLVLRDENLDLMDQHLTNGGRSIPKLLIYKKDTGEVVTTWGPRPAPVQKMVVEYNQIDKETRPPYSEFVKVVQVWYNKDKNKTLQTELLEVLKGIN